MAATGGSASIITQVQQGGPSLTTLGGKITRHSLFTLPASVNLPLADTASEENLTLDLRYLFFFSFRALSFSWGLLPAFINLVDDQRYPIPSLS